MNPMRRPHIPRRTKTFLAFATGLVVCSIRGLYRTGVASVSLMDANGRKRIVLQVTPDGAPSIAFLDADGKVLNQLGPGSSK